MGIGKDRNITRGAAEKSCDLYNCAPGIVVGCDPTDQICTRTVQLFEPSRLQTCNQNELRSFFEV